VIHIRILSSLASNAASVRTGFGDTRSIAEHGIYQSRVGGRQRHFGKKGAQEDKYGLVRIQHRKIAARAVGKSAQRENNFPHVLAALHACMRLA